ncbi:MAG: hypothetical protein KAW09_10455, partial [Thermoplasmata archaeon]|nr:hypothetical protein [Thermoplasmata archaeon]
FTGPYSYTDFEPPGALFAPPHSDYGLDTDIPANGYFDYLVINASINVSTAGDYTLEVLLYDQASMQFIDADSMYLWLDVGQNYVEVWLSGRNIFDSGIDGPYMAYLYLLEGNFTLIDTDVHLTGPYLHTDFEPPGAYFNPPHHDYALDMDVPPNGLYDYLIISVNLTVALPGNYTIWCILDHNMSFIGERLVTTYLDVGPQTVSISYDGYLIRENQTIGPFIAFLYLFDENMIWLDSDFHITDFYTYTDFEPRMAEFAPPHTSYGQDTDSPPNGLNDYLVVEASVMVNKEDDFEIDVLLYSGSGNWMAGTSNTTHLTPGLHTVQLMFDGTEIFLTGHDGQYRVDLTLYSSSDQLLDVDSFLTATSYVHTDFEAPDISPPFSSASVMMPFLRNQGPVMVLYQATDPDPTDGLDYVSLYYSYSLDNTTFGPWTMLQSVAVSGETSTGAFLFDCPAGEGFYQLYTIAGDISGNVESPPPQSDATFQYQVPNEIFFTYSEPSIEAGTKGSFGVGVTNATGVSTPLENPLTLNLVTTSSIGFFVEAGSVNQITTVTINTGEHSAAFDYYDERTGSYLLTVAGFLGTISTSLSVTPGPLDSID